MAASRSKVSPLKVGPDAVQTASLPSHGAAKLPGVRVDSYNLDPEHQGERLAAYTNKRALKMFVDKWRKLARRSGPDPFGKRDSFALTKKELDEGLNSENEAVRSVVHGAIEDFSRSLALLVQRFLVLRDWQRTECIVIGGGLPASQTGRLIVCRARALLHHAGIKVDMRPITADPHDAALLGSAHLFPSWALARHDAFVAADLGGTNLRVGVVRLPKGQKDLSKAQVWKRTVWRHADHEVSRDDIVRAMVKEMKKLIRKAEDHGLRVAPLIGVGCPGSIARDGSIGNGSEVLPGNWQTPKFNLPSQLAQGIPRIGGSETLVLLHNDAVVQGLSELPLLGRTQRWGIFTVGTGLGNARFTRQETGG
jgi:hypothetical protein